MSKAWVPLFSAGFVLGIMFGLLRWESKLDATNSRWEAAYKTQSDGWKEIVDLKEKQLDLERSKLQESEMYRSIYASMVMKSQPIEGGCWIVNKRLAEDAKVFDDRQVLINGGIICNDDREAEAFPQYWHKVKK